MNNDADKVIIDTNLWHEKTRIEIPYKNRTRAEIPFRATTEAWNINHNMLNTLHHLSKLSQLGHLHGNIHTNTVYVDNIPLKNTDTYLDIQPNTTYVNTHIKNIGGGQAHYHLEVDKHSAHTQIDLQQVDLGTLLNKQRSKLQELRGTLALHYTATQALSATHGDTYQDQLNMIIHDVYLGEYLDPISYSLKQAY